MCHHLNSGFINVQTFVSQASVVPKLIISLFQDELQLLTEMENDANTAVAEVSKDVSKEVLIYGILKNKILRGATVLGFSRSGNFMNKEFFDERLDVYSIIEVVFDDIEEIILNHAKNPGQMRSMLNQIKQIGLNQILFVMKVLQLQGDEFEKISTATDLFLIILRENLAFQSHKRDTTYSKLLTNEEKELLKILFQLCKENLQDEDDDNFLNRTLNYFNLNPSNKVDKQQKQAGVVTGSVTDENWVPDASETGIPINFLKRVGIFDIPPARYDQLTLTAQHLSFVEFFAAVGILLSSDIKGGL